MAKQIKYGEEARRALEKGVNALPVLANDGRLLGEVDRGAMVAELIGLFGRICPELR